MNRKVNVLQNPSGTSAIHKFLKRSRRGTASKYSVMAVAAAAVAGTAQYSRATTNETWSSTAATTAWNSAPNWGGTIPNSTGFNAIFDSTSYLNQPSLGTTPESIANITFGDGTTVTAALTLSGTAGLNLSGGAIAVFANTGAVTISAPVQLNTATTVTDNSSNLFTISGPLVFNSGSFITTGSGNILLSGNISGNSGINLQSSYTGTTTLSGTNSFTGGVTLGASNVAGQLNINSNTALGGTASTFSIFGGVIDNTSGSAVAIANANPINWGGSDNFTYLGSNDLSLGTGAMTVGSGDTVTTLGSHVLTFADAINGSFTKTGSGTLQFNGASTSLGTLTVNQGTVVISTGGSMTAALSIGSAALNVTSTTTGTQSFGGATFNAGLTTVTIASGSTRSVSFGSLSRNAGGAVNLINNGTGTVYTTSSGTIDSSGILGAYAIVNGKSWATLSGSNIVALADGSYNANLGDPNHENFDISASGNINANVETIRYNTASAAITTNISQSDGMDFKGTYGGILMTSTVGANNVTITGNSIKAGGGDLYIHQFDTLASLTINTKLDNFGSTYNVVKDGPGTFFLAFNGNESYNGLYMDGGVVSTPYSSDLAGNLNFNGGTLQISSGSQTIGNSIVLGITGGTLDTTSGNTAVYSGSSSGSGNLTVTDAGITSLTGAGSYTGTTTINSGATLDVGGSSGTISSSPTIFVNSGGMLFLDNGNNGNASRLSSSAVLSLSGGIVRMDGTNNNNQENETAGAINVTSGVSSIWYDNAGSNGASFTLHNAAPLTQTNSAVLIIAQPGQDSWSSIGSGTVFNSVPPASVTSQLIGGNGTTIPNNPSVNTTTLSIIPWIIGSFNSGGGILTPSLYGNTFETLIQSNTGAYELVPLYVGPQNNQNSYASSIGSGATNNVLLNATGNGQTISSATTVNSLNLFNGSNVSGGATLTITSGGLILNNPGTTTPISTTGLAFGANTGYIYNVAAASNIATISSAITGTNGVVVSGTQGGRTIFTGANSYSGGTTINAGILEANTPGASNSSTGTGTVNIVAGTLAGGTKAAPGRVSGAVTVNSGAFITAGTGPTATDTIGTLNTSGGQTWNSGGTYAVKIGTTNGSADTLIMNGLTLASSSASPFTIQVTALSGSANTAGNSYVIADVVGGTSSTFNTSNLALLQVTKVGTAYNLATFALSEQTDTLYAGGEDLVLTETSAPEPTSILLLGIAATPLLLGRRRRVVAKSTRSK